jgi:hypothetical protein
MNHIAFFVKKGIGRNNAFLHVFNGNTMPLKLKKARCNRQQVESIENNLLDVGTYSKMLLCARICSEACL